MSPIISDDAATCGLQLQAKSPPADRLYTFYEDTIAAIEELVFPIDPELNKSLLSASSQSFLEDLLDQLIRWGVDIYGRSGSLRAIGETFLGNQIERILARMQDELEVIRLRAQQWQRISQRGLFIGRSQIQVLSQAVVNLKGFTRLIFEEIIKAHQAAVAALNGTTLPPDSDLEEGEIVESIEEDMEIEVEKNTQSEGNTVMTQHYLQTQNQRQEVQCTVYT